TTLPLRPKVMRMTVFLGDEVSIVVTPQRGLTVLTWRPLPARGCPGRYVSDSTTEAAADSSSALVPGCASGELAVAPGASLGAAPGAACGWGSIGAGAG